MLRAFQTASAARTAVKSIQNNPAELLDFSCSAGFLIGFRLIYFEIEKRYVK